jgi:hypothetical protein
VILVGLVAVVVGAAMVYRHTLDRQRSVAAWQDAGTMSSRLEAGGGWEIAEAVPPCSDSSPEAFIVLTATAGHEPETSLWNLTARLQEAGWAVSGKDLGLVGTPAGQGARLIVESVDPNVEVEIDVEETC